MLEPPTLCLREKVLLQDWQVAVEGSTSVSETRMKRLGISGGWWVGALRAYFPMSNSVTTVVVPGGCNDRLHSAVHPQQYKTLAWLL